MHMCCVMMEPAPAAPFVVIDPNLLQFLTVALDTPTHLGGYGRDQ
jgi:hypothetical protein